MLENATSEELKTLHWMVEGVRHDGRAPEEDRDGLKKASIKFKNLSPRLEGSFLFLRLVHAGFNGGLWVIISVVLRFFSKELNPSHNAIDNDQADD